MSIYLLSGPPGAGKSTVATALAQRFAYGIHIPMDDLREWVVAGAAHPENWTDETTRQFGLARTVAAHAATVYADAGFTVTVADVFGPDDVKVHFTDPRCQKILLLPTLEKALERNATRTNKSFDTAGIADLLRHAYAWLIQQDWSGWTVIDSSHLTLDETLAAILEKAS